MVKKRFEHTEEAKQKIGESNRRRYALGEKFGFQKGHKRLKLTNKGDFKKGHKPICPFKKGNHPKTEFKKGHISFWKGKKRLPFSEKQRKNMGKAQKGEKSHFWIDGRTKNKEYVNWSKNKRSRLKRLQNKNGNFHTFDEWELLKKQHGYKCLCCGKSKPEIKLTEDHIIPLSKGGSDFIENIQPLCMSCNNKKHTKIIKYE